MFTKKRKTFLLIILSLILTIGVLTGCGGDENADAEEKDELNVATAYDPKSLDPQAVNDVASSNVMAQIFNTLITLDDDGELIGSLAEEFEQVDDVTYEFKIKEDVQFHNGETMTVEDVIFSMERAANSPALANLYGVIDADSVESTEDNIVTLKLKEPNAGFIEGLILPGASIVSKKAVEDSGESFNMEPIGTGPFEFVSWDKGDKVELERFDDYFGEAPAFGKMVIRAIPESTSRMIELETGAVDVAYEISANDISRIEEDEDLQLTRLLDNSTQYLGLNNAKEPFDDIKVRQAIDYALDIPTIVESAWKGVGEVAKGPMSENIKYFDQSLERVEQDVEKSKELLKEAGYPDGFSVKLWTNEKQERTDMATIIENQLQDVGIDAEIEILEWGSYIESLGNGEQDMFIIGWTGQSGDPDVSLYGPLSQETLGAGANFAFYDNDKMNDLLLEGRSTEDSPEREAIYHEIQELFIEDTPWIPLNTGEAVLGSAKYINNLELSEFGYHPLYQITFDE